MRVRTAGGIAALLTISLFAAPVAAQLYGASPFQNEFYELDMTTGAAITTTAVTVPTRVIVGINAVTIDPTTGTAYAIVRATGVAGRLLITIDLDTAAGVEIGNLGDNFSSLAFRNDGQLFGTTGDGATTPETLFLIDKATAATTVAVTLGNGADGELIAYNPTDDSFGHWSGNGTVVYERISATTPFGVTGVPITGAPNGERFGAVWDECQNTFITSSIASTFQLWSAGGVVGTAFGANPDDIRGMALVGAPTCDVDLAPTMTIVPQSPANGAPVTITITVPNAGPARALTPDLAIVLPAVLSAPTSTECPTVAIGASNCALPTLFGGEQFVVTINATYNGGTGSVVATATTTSDDTANGNNSTTGVVGPVISVTPTAGLVTTEAGATATFDVVLLAAPSADVTVPIASGDITEGTVNTASLTFTPANFAAPQTVTLAGADDFLLDGNVAYTATVGTLASADANFNGVDPPDVSATNNDNDVAGVTVAPTTGLATTESAGTATFTVVLTAQPTADVTIGMTSSDTTEATVAPATLTFTSVNFNVPQTVTVTGVDDPLVDGAQPWSIVTTTTASADPNFNGLAVDDVLGSNADNDAAGITVAPTTGLATTEAGGTATFTVVLTAQPSADVAIALSSSDTTEATVAPPALTFTSANFNVPQTVTVTGVDDALVDGAQPWTIVTAAATSADAAFNGVNAADAAGSNADNETAGITVNPTAGLATTEAGTTATFTVVLNAQPSADVTVGLSSGDATEASVAPASLTFTNANFNVPQTVTVTGVDDALVDGTQPWTIVTAPAASADVAFNGINPADVAGSNADNDAAAATVAPTTGLTVTEGGGTATFTVVLTAQPTADVTFALSSSDTTEATVAPPSLTFTAANFNVPQLVTVTGVDDAAIDGPQPWTIVTGPAVSGDPAYSGLNPADVTGTTLDNDVAAPISVPTLDRLALLLLAVGLLGLALQRARAMPR